ncbi:MAG: hypothetical protein QY309_07605 [Cyclobacteriaceae bacterium]|nr:MAG: hypothetical protein QY309_07605 [Cyclobacteriaceae bacterium]
MKKDIVQLFNQNKRGITIPGELYSALSSLILSKILEKPSGKLFLTELLDYVYINKDKLSDKGNIGWWLIQVKRDLSARNIIRTSITPTLRQYLELKKSKRLATYLIENIVTLRELRP